MNGWRRSLSSEMIKCAMCCVRSTYTLHQILHSSRFTRRKLKKIRFHRRNGVALRLQLDGIQRSQWICALALAKWPSSTSSFGFDSLCNAVGYFKFFKQHESNCGHWTTDNIECSQRDGHWTRMVSYRHPTMKIEMNVQHNQNLCD